MVVTDAERLHQLVDEVHTRSVQVRTLVLEARQMAHAINAHLTTVIGTLDLMALEPGLTDQQRGDIVQMMAAALAIMEQFKRLHALIRQISPDPLPEVVP